MTPQSAKAKGRKFQQWVRDKLLFYSGGRLHPDDVQSRSMGAGGEDIILSASARELFPISIECKAQEKVNVWGAFEQASANAKDGYFPVLFIRRNRTEPLAVIRAEDLFLIFSAYNEEVGEN